MQQLISKRVLTVSVLEYFLRTIVLRYLVAKNAEFSAKRSRKMAVYANDYIGADIFINGVYEKEEIKDLLDICLLIGIDMGQSAAIDVGANIGNHTLAFAAHFSRVDAFEPHPDTYKLLSFNTSRITNVYTHPVGVGAEQAKQTMSECEANYGCSSAVIMYDDAQTYEIEIMKLDDYLPDVQNLKLIKIDVEGMEYAVLKGAEQLIIKHQPVIAFEQLTDDFIDQTHETPATRFLLTQGYEFLWMEQQQNYTRCARYLELLRTIVSGRNKRTRKMMTGDELPRRFHPLIVALPQELMKKLKQSI